MDPPALLARIRDVVTKGAGPVLIEGTLDAALPLLTELDPADTYVISPDASRDVPRALELGLNLCDASFLPDLLAELSARQPILVRMPRSPGDPGTVGVITPTTTPSLTPRAAQEGESSAGVIPRCSAETMTLRRA